MKTASVLLMLVLVLCAGVATAGPLAYAACMASCSAALSPLAVGTCHAFCDPLLAAPTAGVRTARPMQLPNEASATEAVPTQVSATIAT